MSDPQPPPLLPKHAARIFQMPDGVIQVIPTRKSGPAQNDRYIVDHHENGKMKERWVNNGADDATLATAVRAALNGEL